MLALHEKACSSLNRNRENGKGETRKNAQWNSLQAFETMELSALNSCRSYIEWFSKGIIVVIHIHFPVSNLTRNSIHPAFRQVLRIP